MSHFHYQLIWYGKLALWLVAVGCAFWRGDRPAREIAAIFFVAALVVYGLDKGFDPPTAVWFGIDTVALALMIVVAVRAPRPWVLAVTGFALASAATHVAAVLDGRIGKLAYLTAIGVWWVLQLLALLWGTFAAPRRNAAPAPA